jgi:hypothetical protein
LPASRTSCAPRGSKFSGVGRPFQDRPDLVAQESDRDRKQHQRRSHHPQQEDMRVRRIRLAAARKDPQHLALELNADFHDIGVADRVDPERPVDLPHDFRTQRLIENGKERLRARRRQRVRRQDVDVELHALLRDAHDVAVIVRIGIGLDQVDDGRYVARHGRRKAEGYSLPVAFHEHEGDHRLQKQHRRNDDYQRAGIKPLGKILGQQPTHTIPYRGQRALRLPRRFLVLEFCLCRRHLFLFPRRPCPAAWSRQSRQSGDYSTLSL